MSKERETTAPEHLTPEQRKWDTILKLYFFITHFLALISEYYDRHYPYKSTGPEPPQAKSI